MTPKILVACPTSDHKAYCPNEYANVARSLSYSNFDFFLVDNSKGNEYFERIKSFGVNVGKAAYTEPVRKTKSLNKYNYLFCLI